MYHSIYRSIYRLLSRPLFIAAQDSTGMLIKFLIAWFAIQLLHGDLVVPRVMGDRLQIHPITILVVLLVMGI